MTERRDPSDHNVLIRYWCDLYVEHVGTKYPFNGGKDGATIKWLRGIYTDDEIRGFMTAFFEMDDPFIVDSGFSLGVFRGCLPKVIKVVQSAKPKTDANGHCPPCRTQTICNQRHFEDVTGKRSQAS